MLLGFKKQFIEPIQIGTKVFTLRKRRKVRPKIGETIHMYSGLRTKNTTFIGNKEKLVSIQNVRILIKVDHHDPYGDTHYIVRIFVDRRRLRFGEIIDFIRFDGFKDVAEFIKYWLTDEKGKRKTRTGALMELYHWTDLKY